MQNWLFSWNPENWAWQSLEQDRARTASGETATLAWRAHAKQMREGDVAYLVRIGVNPKGIVARGHVVKAGYEAPHYDPAKAEAGKTARYVDIEFTEIRSPDHDPIVPLATLEAAAADQTWNPQASGIAIGRQAADALEALWRELPPVHEGEQTSPDRPLPPLLEPARNLILYGPPGTGKTFATATEAVRLCGKLVPEDRRELKRSYDTLVEAGQIAFVTFHQNYAYEDFVEGLRPTTGTGDEDQPGFRLEPRPGIFREISALAEQARKTPGHRGGFDMADRRVFKMSLGRAGVEDHIFEAAIEGNYVVLGWGGDIDWSDPHYDGDAAYDAIHEAWNKIKPGTKGNSGHISQLWRFRSSMREGDLVVVSRGNSHFRAVGEITGPYRYDPTTVPEYNHRRAVRWLLVPDEPLPVDAIYGKPFTMRSCYLLDDGHLKREALARLLPGKAAATDAVPDQFVLIIDEINRANISKVFGELITLLEPDKRIGADNELEVKLPYSGDTFGVPANLHIIGTMNTADRSIALLDTALRRRFEFRELMPEPACLPDDVEGVPLRALLRGINERIEYLFDREHQIGHAYFIGCKDRAAVDAVMRGKVIPLLAEYFYEDWAKVALVLGDADGQGGFLERQLLKAPAGLNDVGAQERYRWTVRGHFADDVYERFR